MLDIRKEIEFWTGIMRDHAIFQYNNLSPKETNFISRTQHFAVLFQNLQREAINLSENTTKIEISNFIMKNFVALTNFIEFKRHMLAQLMQCNLALHFPPTFLNHMINEALEYYRVLCMAKGTMAYNKALENIRLHKVWLPDASGHAAMIAAQLDPVEVELAKQSRGFVKIFDGLNKKAVEIYPIYERTGLQDGALTYFNKQVEEALKAFIVFLNNIEILRTKCKVLGTTMPEVPDHMKREEEYYLYRIQMINK